MKKNDSKNVLRGPTKADFRKKNQEETFKNSDTRKDSGKQPNVKQDSIWPGAY